MRNDDAVDQADIGFGEIRDREIHFVLDAEKLAGGDRVFLAAGTDLDNVAAGTEGAVAFARDHDGMDIVIGRPSDQMFVHPGTHILGQ